MSHFVHIPDLNNGRKHISEPSLLDLKNGSRLASIFRNLKFYSSKRRIRNVSVGSSRFIQSGSWSPVINNLTRTPVEFDQVSHLSDCVYIGRKFGLYSFFVAKKGIYDVSTCLVLSVGSYAVTQLSVASIYLYRNNVAYSLLDSQNMCIRISLNNNYHFPFVVLQGSDSVYLKEGDSLKIMFEHNSIALPPASLDADDTWSGFLNISFNNHKSLPQ